MTETALHGVSDGVENLASTVTSALGQAGPAGALLDPVVDALRNVWEGYFGAPIPPGGTNWNSYTHEQLYQMLWQNADVGDVSDVAAQWGQHGATLTEHANALQGQRTALQSNWSGQAAEPAANRLGDLGTRTSGIGGRANSVGQAAQHAGDALAVARNTMPPPPGNPTGLVAAGAVAGAGAGAAIGAVLGAGAGGIGALPGAAMGAAIGAVVGGGGSMFLASVMAAEQKAEAVHVMQQYEASLADSGKTIAATPAGATDAAAFGSTSTAGYAGAGTGSGSGVGLGDRGVPWGQLIGAQPPQSGGLGAPASDLGAGGALRNALLAQDGEMSELAAESGAGEGGMWPGMGSRARGGEDKEHQNRMPTVDHGLFTDNERAVTPVIGL